MKLEQVGALIAEASRAPPEVTARLLAPRHGCSFTGNADFGMMHREEAPLYAHTRVHRRQLALVCDTAVLVRVLWVRVVVPAQHASRDTIFALVPSEGNGPTSSEPREAAILWRGQSLPLELTAEVSAQTELGLRKALVVAALQIDSAIDLMSLTASTHTFLIATKCVGVVATHDDFSMLRTDAKPFFPEAVRRLWQVPVPALGYTLEPVDPLRPWYSANVTMQHEQRCQRLVCASPAGDPWAQPHSAPPPLPSAGAAGGEAGCWPDAADCTLLAALRAMRQPSAEQQAAAQQAVQAGFASALGRWAEEHAAHFGWQLLWEERQMAVDYELLDLHFVSLFRKRASNACFASVAVAGAEEKRPALLYGDLVRVRFAQPTNAPDTRCEFVGWVSDASNPRSIQLCFSERFGRAFEKAAEKGRKQEAARQVHLRWVLNPRPLQAMAYALDAFRLQTVSGTAACRLVSFRSSMAQPAAAGEAPAEGSAAEANGPAHAAGAQEGGRSLAPLAVPLVNSCLNEEQRHAVPLVNSCLNEEQRHAVHAVLARSRHALPASAAAAAAAEGGGGRGGRDEFAAPSPESHAINGRAAAAPPPPPPAGPEPPVPAESVCAPLPYVVWGPPGTGKTSVLVEQVLQLLAQARDASQPHGTAARVLVCAPSNGAADVVLQRLVEHGSAPSFRAAMGWQLEGGQPHCGWVHRLNSSRRSLASLPTPLHKHCCIVDGMFAYLRAQQYRETPVIVSTCVAALDLLACGAVGTAAAGVPCGHFSHILIDEATQGLEPELLIPLVLGRPPSRGGCVVVLVGDHRQLGPTVRSAACRQGRHGLDQSLLARLMRMYEQDGGSALEPGSCRRVRTLESCCTMLRRNYRSHPALLEVPSALFYKGQLLCAADPAESHSLVGWSELRREDSARSAPLLFYGLVGQQLHEVDSPSFFNPTEASMLVRLASKLLDAGLGLTTNDLGVITIYRKQVLKLRRLLREKGLGAVRVGSVDDYQGQEEKVILISTVLSHTEAAERAAGADGALSDSLMASAQRFNVAITRAKALLVVIGNPHALAAHEHWRALLRFALERGTYRGVPFSLDGPTGAADAADEDEETEAMLSRLAESALGGGYALRGGVAAAGLGGADELNLSNDLEWRLMI